MLAKIVSWHSRDSQAITMQSWAPATLESCWSLVTFGDDSATTPIYDNAGSSRRAPTMQHNLSISPCSVAELQLVRKKTHVLVGFLAVLSSVDLPATRGHGLMAAVVTVDFFIKDFVAAPPD
jgi:hypothetical protein